LRLCQHNRNIGFLDNRAKTQERIQMNFGFIIDNRKCIGCHACTVACKAEHEVPVGVNRTWVKYIEKGEFPNTRRLFSVMRCNHCADAPCVEICPVTALFTREDGIVDFDSRRCIGCKACTQACPYDALYLHPDEHTAAKCNYCSHRTDIGLEPACVNVCPEHAIISGDMDNPFSEISQLLARESVQVRKPEKGTKPKLFYIEGDAASLRPTEADQNTAYMWSSQSSGVGYYARFAEERVRRSTDQTAPQALYQIEARKKNQPRRVYDAPAKGVLWGWEVSAYILTKAIATGAFLLPVVGSYFLNISPIWRQIGGIVSFLFLAATGVLLIMDLGRPDRFLNVLLRPQWRSWLTRGAYIITGFGGVLTVWLAAEFFGFGLIQKIIEPFGIVLALLSAVYTAFLFAQAKGRDFWQSPMLGLHMLVHALMAGLAVFLLANSLFDLDSGFQPALRFFAVAVLVFHLLGLAIELASTHTTDDAHMTVKMITHGEFAKQFWVGMVLVGNVLPLILLLITLPWAFALAGILILTGLWFAEDIWVKAPQRIPLS
jgi:Fe-S-cluster-containing dehydrogenase component/formate-dependent nitrite reductase membrane component NrfD